ncbi:N-acetylglucosamine-6-phosphate deacetylase [Paenibacillus sp. CC-CFT747]|nr:N-acetylglucosamine-6-phosphate deacetylase [Paenibacillus sp. CC-CFT747]
MTSYFPTVITNGDEAIAQAVRSIAEACRQDPVSAAGIGGIHLEGPFLSPEDGPRGAHDRRFTKAPDWDLFQSWQEAADGKILIVTLSPEWPGSAAFIEQCTKSGVIVSIGHTAAEPAQIREAVSAGATLSTHFGNGAHLTLPRHPNYLWEQLAEDGLSTCVIADGFHLPSSVLKVVLRTKGRQAMLVSDAVHFSGMEPGDYVSHIGGQVTLTEEGRLHLTGNAKILAGSAQMLPWGISHLVKEELATLADAWEMASIRPAAFVGQPASQGMTAGAPADLVLMDQKDGRFQVRTVYKNGQKVWG